jgi:D-glycero-D-manno-heptose 1,7-bisphosphate phosphatase
VGVDAVRQAVFLDRDGVINRSLIRDGKPYAPLTLADVEIAPGVPDALQQLRDAGFLLIVVTNQPDVIRRQGSRREIDAIHAHMRKTLPIDDVRVCYHDDPSGCACRKPSPGMLYAAAVEHEIQFAGSYLVGDRWRDIVAGQRAGCTTILVDGGHDETTTVEPDARLQDLPEAAAWILRRRDAQP